MTVLVLNGSPRPAGKVVALLRLVAEAAGPADTVDWVDVPRLSMAYCTGCMACRRTGRCALPEDDAHRMADRIREADVLLIGTPTHWGNMSAPLKVLFDRTVPVFMDESPRGLPLPQQKGKRAAVVTACNTPWPFNTLLPESRGAVRAVREVLHYGGYRVVGTIALPGARKVTAIPASLAARARRLGQRLLRR